MWAIKFKINDPPSHEQIVEAVRLGPIANEQDTTDTHVTHLVTSLIKNIKWHAQLKVNTAYYPHMYEIQC